MSYKLEEAKLMAYLYGELSYEEKREVEELMKQHPEIQDELDQLQGVRGILGKLEDKEVIEPVIFHEKKEKTPYLRTIIALAASVSLIIIIGYLTNLKINFSKNQLVVQFGENHQVKDDVKEAEKSISDANKFMASINQNNQTLQRQVDSLKMQLRDYATTSELISKQIENSLNKKVLATKSQLESYSLQQQEINKEAILSLFSQSDEQQKQYVNSVLTDYANYLDGRREQDIQFYIDGLRTIKEDYDLKQFETEQLLASLITTTGQALPGEYQAGSK